MYLVRTKFRQSWRDVSVFWIVIVSVVNPAGRYATGLHAEEPADELVQMVVGFISDDDKDIRALAFEQVRGEIRGAKATRQFAAQLLKIPSEAQVGLLRALADRGDREARSAVLDLLNAATDGDVRFAAIESLGTLGVPDDVSLLVKLLGSKSDRERKAAHGSLVRLPGEQVPILIAESLSTAKSGVQIELLKVLAEKRGASSVPAILEAALGTNPKVRQEAMRALGQLANAQHVPQMLKGVLKAERGRERSAAEKAVMFVCARIEPTDHRAAPVLDVMKTMNQRDQTTLLSTVGRIGGAQALAVVEKAIVSSDASKHAAGIAALSNWPNASIAERLMELSQKDKHLGHRLTSLRALIRIAPLSDGRPDHERLALLKKAMTMTLRDAEKHLVLDRARAIRIPQTLDFVVPYLDEPAHAQQACFTIVELAHHRTLREQNKEAFHLALDRVMQISTDPIVVQRANRYKNNQTWTGK